MLFDGRVYPHRCYRTTRLYPRDYLLRFQFYEQLYKHAADEFFTLHSVDAGSTLYTSRCVSCTQHSTTGTGASGYQQRPRFGWCRGHFRGPLSATREVYCSVILDCFDSCSDGAQTLVSRCEAQGVVFSKPQHTLEKTSGNG